MNFFIGVGLALGVLALVELARTAIARLCGVRIERFAGVAIRFDGPRRRRAVPIAIGPIAGYLAIAALAFVGYCAEGRLDERLFVRDLVADSAAAGTLAPGDQVLTVDGQRVFMVRDVAERVEAKRGAPLTIRFSRDGTEHTVELAPRRVDDRWRLGIAFEYGRTRDIRGSVTWAIRAPIDQLRATFASWRDLFAGSDADPGGPVRIVEELAWHRPSVADIAFSGVALAIYLWLVLIILDLIRLARLFRR